MKHIPYDILPEFDSEKARKQISAFKLHASIPIMKLMRSMTLTPPGITEQHATIPGWNGLPMRVDIFSPENVSANAPCLLDIHGGGFGMMAAPYQKLLACEYARGAGCRVVFPDYHLLPDYRYPAAVEDSLAAYRWIAENAAELDIDRSRIAICGDSAGGNLAALVTNMAVARGLPNPCFQMLIYPVTDARMETESMQRFTDTPMWNAVSNRLMWDMYLEDVPDDKRDNASPMLMPLPENIPDTYLETAEFDCLHDEGVNYAHRLEAAGANVQLYETKGTIHGYEIVRLSPLTRESVKRRIEILKNAFLIE